MHSKVNHHLIKELINFNAFIDHKHPFLKNILITIQNDSICFTAANNYVIIKKYISIENPTAEPIKQQILIKAKPFLDAIKKYTSPLEIYIENNKLVIEDKYGKLNFSGSSEKYPDINTNDFKLIGSLSEENFQNALKATSIELDNGFFKFIFKNNIFTSIAFDNKKLAYYEVNGSFLNESSIDFGFNPDLLKYLKKLKNSVNFYIHDNQMIIDNKQEIILLKKQSTKDISHKRLTGNLFNFQSLKLQDIKKAVEKSIITSSELVQDILLDFNENLTIMSYDNTVGYSRWVLSLNNREKPTPYSCSLNGKDFLNILENCIDENLIISRSTNERDIVIQNGSAFYVIAQLVVSKTIKHLDFSADSMDFDSIYISEKVKENNVIVEHKSPFLPMRNIQIKKEKNKIKFSSSNNEIYIINSINQQYEDFSIQIRSMTLFESLASFNGKIHLSYQDNKIKISDNYGFFILFGSEGNINHPNIDEEVTACVNNFGESLKAICFTIQDKGYCKISLDNNKILMTVFDKKRIAFCEIPAETTEKRDFFINPRYIKNIANLNNNLIIKSSKNLIISDDNTDVFLKAMEPTNMDPRSFLSSLNEYIEIDRSLLKSALEKVLLNIDQNGSNKVKLKCDGESLEMTYYDYIDDNQAIQVIECIKGFNISMSLNGFNILDILRLMKEQKIKIYASESNNKVIFVSGKFHYVNIKLVNN